LASSQTFAALFELELAGRMKQLPGKNYSVVSSDLPGGGSWWRDECSVENVTFCSKKRLLWLWTSVVFGELRDDAHDEAC